MLCIMKATDHKILEAMIEQMNQSTARADAALDRTLEFVGESEKRIATLVAIASDYPSETAMDVLRKLPVPKLKKSSKSLF